MQDNDSLQELETEGQTKRLQDILTDGTTDALLEIQADDQGVAPIAFSTGVATKTFTTSPRPAKAGLDTQSTFAVLTVAAPLLIMTSLKTLKTKEVINCLRSLLCESLPRLETNDFFAQAQDSMVAEDMTAMFTPPHTLTPCTLEQSTSIVRTEAAPVSQNQNIYWSDVQHDNFITSTSVRGVFGKLSEHQNRDNIKYVNFRNFIETQLHKVSPKKDRVSTCQQQHFKCELRRGGDIPTQVGQFMSREFQNFIHRQSSPCTVVTGQLLLENSPTTVFGMSPRYVIILRAGNTMSKQSDTSFTRRPKRLVRCDEPTTWTYNTTEALSPPNRTLQQSYSVSSLLRRPTVTLFGHRLCSVLTLESTTVLSDIPRHNLHSSVHSWQGHGSYNDGKHCHSRTSFFKTLLHSRLATPSRDSFFYWPDHRHGLREPLHLVRCLLRPLLWIIIPSFNSPCPTVDFLRSSRNSHIQHRWVSRLLMVSFTTLLACWSSSTLLLLLLLQETLTREAEHFVTCAKDFCFSTQTLLGLGETPPPPAFQLRFYLTDSTSVRHGHC